MKIVNYDKPYYCSDDQYTRSHPGEMLINIDHGSKRMIGESHKMHHHMVVESKVAHHTSLSERKNTEGPHPDVSMNYSRLPKVNMNPLPNDSGNPVYKTLYKKSAKMGMAKGGIKHSGKY